MATPVPDTEKPKDPNGLVRWLVLGAIILFVIVWAWWVNRDDGQAPAKTQSASSRPGQPPEPPFALAPAPSEPAVGVRVGNLALDIQGEDVDGQRFKLSDYRGKVVLLDFWGDW
jgi:hypothetical protein